MSQTSPILQSDFSIYITSYGGFAGKGQSSYSFSSTSDSVEVKVTEHSFPKEGSSHKISKSDFEEIKNRIICLSSLNVAGEPRLVGCQPPFEYVYQIKTAFSKIRIYPSKQDTCSLTSLLHKPAHPLIE